jgi:homoserine acetyltransferase
MEVWAIVPTIIGIVVGVIGFLTKRSVNEVDAKIDRTNIRMAALDKKIDDVGQNFQLAINRVQKELYEYKAHVADEFTKKKDLNSALYNIDKKIDKLMDMILELNRKER